MQKDAMLFIPDKLPTSVSCDDGKICIDWELGDNVDYTMEITKNGIESTKFVGGKVETEEYFRIECLYAEKI